MNDLLDSEVKLRAEKAFAKKLIGWILALAIFLWGTVLISILYMGTESFGLQTDDFKTDLMVGTFRLYVAAVIMSFTMMGMWLLSFVLLMRPAP